MTHSKGAARPAPSSWQEELTESKIDMGLLDVVTGAEMQGQSRSTRLKNVLKSWEGRKTNTPRDQDAETLRETGT